MQGSILSGYTHEYACELVHECNYYTHELVLIFPTLNRYTHELVLKMTSKYMKFMN